MEEACRKPCCATNGMRQRRRCIQRYRSQNRRSQSRVPSDHSIYFPVGTTRQVRPLCAKDAALWPGLTRRG